MNEELAKLSWKEKANLCKQWQDSGLSKTKFSAQKKIALATFTGWCARLWPSQQRSQPQLCQLKIRGSKKVVEAEKEGIVVELLCAEVVTARIKASGMQARFLLQELLHASTTIRQKNMVV